MTEEKITGIILAGGKSLRMGIDKGFCHLAGKPMVQYSIEALQPFCDEIIICANQDSYSKFGFPVITDEHHHIGPIAGLYSGLKASKNDHNLVVSCDIPLIRKELFVLLLQYAKNKQVVIPQIGNHFEPLSAYYHKSVLKVIRELINSKKKKLLNILDQVHYHVLQQEDFHGLIPKQIFTNVNTPDVLKQLEKSLNDK